MQRFVMFALVMTVAASAAGLEEQQRASKQLASPRLVDKAWGAYWAGRLHEPSLNDALIRCLSEAQVYVGSEPEGEEHAYVLALFDAVIEAGIKVPDSVSRRMAR